MEEQNLNEKLNMVSRQILLVSRNELYLKMRFLDVALSSFAFVMDENIESVHEVTGPYRG